MIRLKDPGQFRPFRLPAPPQGIQSPRADAAPLHHPDPGLHLFQPALLLGHPPEMGKCAPAFRPDHRLLDDKFLFRRRHPVEGFLRKIMDDKLVKGENPDPVCQPGIALQAPAHLRCHPRRGHKVDDRFLSVRQTVGPPHPPGEAGYGIQMDDAGHGDFPPLGRIGWHVLPSYPIRKRDRMHLSRITGFCRPPSMYPKRRMKNGDSSGPCIKRTFSIHYFSCVLFEKGKGRSG